MRKKSYLSAFSISFFLIALVGFTPIWASSSPPSPGIGADMLQFKAGGHVLGFRPNKAYLASLDHALSVEFVGTPGVIPKSSAIPQATGSTPKAPLLSKVVYQNLWEGISLTYQSTKDGITESIYCLEPGADVSKIRLQYNVPVHPQKDGSLTFKFGNGFLTESAPVAWQEIEGKRVPVTVAFIVSGEEVGFRLGKYDRNQALIIDPTYAWHTFYGSATDDEEGRSIAVDSSGNVYITGYSASGWNGPQGQTPLHAFNGDWNIFVLKLNSSGAYQWHTFYGENDDATGIGVDSNGNVYVTGFSSVGWLGPSGQNPLHSHDEIGNDIFILKLDTNGAYQWHTFLGADGSGMAYGIAIDGSGNVLVTGIASASMTGPNGEAPLHPYPDEGFLPFFILKLNTHGDYQWHTLYGSTFSYAFGIAADNSGNVYATGYCDDSWIGLQAGAPLNPHSGGFDIFVLKLNSSGAYQWHTFYGGSDEDSGNGVAADSSGNVYVTGYSSSGWVGPSGQNPVHAYDGSGVDIFVLKLDNAGAYQWHTFYGTSGYGAGISVDTGGNVYIAGTIDGSAHWNGPSGQLPLYSNNSGAIFVQKLDPSGAYKWHAFYGTEDDWGLGIAVRNGNIYITGSVFSSPPGWNGPGGQLPLHSYSGDLDIVVLKMAAHGVVDFNGDRKADILLRNTLTGENVVWYMDGQTFIGWADLPSLPNPALVIAGVNDFNNDGKPDILWRNTATGQNYVWYMDGTAFIGWAEFPPLPNPALAIVATGDFNGDGRADILWRDTSTGHNYVWYMSGETFLGWAELPPLPDTSWTIVGTGDLNNDGSADILWRNTTTGQNYVWYMNGGEFIGWAELPPLADSVWKIVGR